MDEDFSDLSGLVFLPDNRIRSAQSNLQTQLDSFHKKIPDANFVETYGVCEDVRDKILNCDDESHLSKVHNNSRRISIASELFISICSIYGYIVDCEFTKIIHSLIQWEKYKCISKKITHKMQLELKREKYFEKEAQRKLCKTLQDGDDETVQGPGETPRPTERKEKLSPYKEQEIKGVEPAEVTYMDEMSTVMGLPSEYSARDEISNISGNITVMRAESPIDASLLQFPNTHMEREVNSLVTSLPEIAIRETTLQENAEDDINKILEILEKEVDGMEVLETSLESPAMVREPAEQILGKKPSTHREDDRRVDQSESEESEEWKLPHLEPPKKTQKKHRCVKIDEAITIRNYSERALYLNSNIKIQRVQVYEGPPKVLQAMSSSHLMKTPGFRSSLFQDVRSSKLSRLFERHLKVEKQPVECMTVPKQRAVEDLREIEISKMRAAEELVEDFGARAGMYSLPGKGDVLAEVAKEKSGLEETEISGSGVLQKESLIGMPVSRIITSTAPPPDVEKINSVSVSHVPRVQQLQGKSLDPEPHSSWFHSAKKTPPSAKYREFSYVLTKLEECWSLLESRGMKKSVTLGEFFRFEADDNVANFLTVLRILDKLSIQRKVLLKYRDRDVSIQPFESPFVSEEQLRIKDDAPVF